MNLSPIVIFTYNRPSHTQQLLNSLAANQESKNSLLYIYCDGAKETDKDDVLLLISETRTIVKNENRFKKVIITEQSSNKGLAHSIIDGVTEVINEHSKVIVLEDDLVVSPFFLCYMNDSLIRYENNNKVGQIGACNFFACGKKFPSVFFTHIPDCLGWATWKSKWSKFNPDAQQLLIQLRNNDLIHKFNAYGSYDYERMLLQQIDGRGTSWAVKWTAVCVLNNWLTLYPNPSLTNHLESQNATNANFNISPPLMVVEPNLRTIKVKEINKIIRAMKRSFHGNGDFYGNSKNSFFNQFKKILYSKWQRLKTFLNQLLPQ